MPARTRPEFSFDRPFAASVSGGLVWNGKRYKHGEPFPWRQLGITDEGIWDLWTQFQVDNAPAVPGVKPVASVSTKHQHRR